MSPVCNRFVQNAWRKDMCSNCFKGKEEHSVMTMTTAPKKMTCNIKDVSVESILKSKTVVGKKPRTVSFSPEPVQIIGFGGEEWSDGETEDKGSDGDDDDDSDDSKCNGDATNDADERELELLTKTNTDINSNAVELKKSVGALLLGKPLTDAEGKKQTLTVSVTPFGQDVARIVPRKITKVSHIPIARNNKENAMAEKKQTVILTSYKNRDVGVNALTVPTQNEKRAGDAKTVEPTFDRKEFIVGTEDVQETEDKSAAELSSPEKADESSYEDGGAIIAEENARTEPMLAKTELNIQLSVPVQSREQAGEPDGRADPEEICEPPALPLTPPPPPRVSFLHGLIVSEKPKVPSKTDKLLQIIKKPAALQPPAELDSKSPNKRRAPDPPAVEETPEPMPRRISSSQDNFNGGVCLNDNNNVSDVIIKKEEPVFVTTTTTSCPDRHTDKRKDKSKTRFSLKKLLRVGSSKDDKNAEKNTKCPIYEEATRPRLVIVHPLELNGSEVEVVECANPAPTPPPRNLPDTRRDIRKPDVPPPKSDELIQKHHYQNQQSSNQPRATNRADGVAVYANLGQVRSGLAPSKPQRTASMREREAMQKRAGPGSNDTTVCEARSIVVDRQDPDDSCSPCSGYYDGSECETNESPEWNGCTARPCKLRSRKGRSIVHKNLEDNYGAVIVANHEALAQVLENIHQTPNIPLALRSLQSSTVLHWNDFSLVENEPSVTVGRRSFRHALWGARHVTLALSKDQIMHEAGQNGFNLKPVTEFSDLIPGNLFLGESENSVQANVMVLPWIQVDTVYTFGHMVKSREDIKEASFALLQIVNCLKNLQAQGIEELPLSMNNFIFCVCKDVDGDTHHKLYLLQGSGDELCHSEVSEKNGSLCQCAMTVLDELMPVSKLAPLLRCLLRKESASSLSQVKSVLEFSLWGPSDVTAGMPVKERELALQRWLDLERATVLHGLVGTRVQLSVLEECHLLFLVRSSAKMMCEASLLLESDGVH